MAESSAMTNFVENLEKTILHLNMTWRQVAVVSGIHEVSLSRIRHGKEGITLDRAESIAAAVGVPLHRLLDPGYAVKQRKSRAKSPAAA